MAREENEYTVARHSLDTLHAEDYSFPGGASQVAFFVSVLLGFPLSMRLKVWVNDGDEIVLSATSTSRHIQPASGGKIYKIRVENLTMAAGEFIQISGGLAFPT